MKHVLLTEKEITDRIHLVRNEKVMLDSDLAALYGVTAKVLNQAVKRNLGRFPADFMYQLTAGEFESLKMKTGSGSWGGRRYLPYAFTEQGVAMLSSVLNSEVAVSVNIQIIRVFTRLRTLVQSNHEIVKKLDQLEKQLLSQDERLDRYEEEIVIVFDAIKKLVAQSEPLLPERKEIGFKRKAESR